MDEIRLGASPLCWMNADFTDFNAPFSVDQCLSDIALIGYEGVELEGPFLGGRTKLPRMLRGKELQCIGKRHATFVRSRPFAEEMEKLKLHLELLASLEGKVVILAEYSGAVHQQKDVSLSHKPRIASEGEWRQLCDSLEKMAELCLKEGFQPAYHHRMGTVIQTEEEIDRLMGGTESLGLLLDTGHLAYADGELEDVLSCHLFRINHVHCSSIRPSVLEAMLAKDASFFTAVTSGVFTAPGDVESTAGREVVDFSLLVERLLDAGYTGWLVMEAAQDPSHADPFHYAQQGYETLHSLLTKGEFLTLKY